MDPNATIKALQTAAEDEWAELIEAYDGWRYSGGFLAQAMYGANPVKVLCVIRGTNHGRGGPRACLVFDIQFSDGSKKFCRPDEITLD